MPELFEDTAITIMDNFKDFINNERLHILQNLKEMETQLLQTLESLLANGS